MIEVKIRHPSTGEVRVHKDPSYADVPDVPAPKPFPYSLADAEWQYSEGNYSCDCNRRLFFERTGSEAVTPTRCSVGEYASFKVEMSCTGKVFYTEFDDE